MAEHVTKRVLFFAPFGSYAVHHQLDAVFATSLALRGCDVRVVGCDGIYHTCDVLAWSGQHAKRDCANCATAGTALWRAFKLPYVQLRDYLTQEDYTRACRWAQERDPSDYANAVYEGLSIGKWVTSSVFSYFRTTPKGLFRPEVREAHRQFLINGLQTYTALSRLVDEYQPTHMCVFNARMAPYRVAFEVARERRINVIIHERGRVDDSFLLFENHTCVDPQPIFECVDIWKDLPLTADQCLSVKNYLSNRENGQNMNYPSFYTYSTDYARIRWLLRIPEHARILGIFTSTEFELVDSEHFKSMATQLEIIGQLIELFRNKDEYLVVRHHPYIAGDSISPPEREFLSLAYQQARIAPDNVRIVMPSEQLSSYALLWSLDACMAFFSTMAIEATACGLATAAFKESAFRQAVYQEIGDISSEYLGQLVDDLFGRTRGFDQTDLRSIYRFIHAYIFRLSTKFKLFGIKNHFEADFRIKELGDLLPGMDPALDRLCDHVITGASLLALPSPEDRRRGSMDEDVFLQHALGEIESRRRQVRRKGALYSASRLNPAVGVVRVSYASYKEDEGPFWTGWRRSRSKQITLYATMGSDDKAYPEVFNLLLSTLKTTSEDYILVAPDFIQYDESFLSSAVDLLLDDQNLTLQGIGYGAWIAHQGDIETEIFTKRRPVDTYQEAVGILPLLGQPHMLLSFCVFRKSALVEILTTLDQFATATQASEAIFAWLNGPTIHKTKLPMLVVTQPTLHEILGAASC